MGRKHSQEDGLISKGVNMAINTNLEEGMIRLAPVDGNNVSIVQIIAVLEAWPNAAGDLHMHCAERPGPFRVVRDGYRRRSGHSIASIW